MTWDIDHTNYARDRDSASSLGQRHNTLNHVDHLGSPVATTNSSGTVIGTQAFFPFGEVRTSTGSFDTQRGFTGQISDAGTGLNFYNARYQDPALGRFISPDSIVPNLLNPTDRNRFAYVSNNPLKFTDPTGHCGQTDMESLSPKEQALLCSRNSLLPAKQIEKLEFGVSDDAFGDLFGEQVSQVELIPYTDGNGDAQVARVGVLNDRSLLGRAVSALNGGGGAITLGFGEYDIISNNELNSGLRDKLRDHELQHLREIDAYGAAVWHGSYQIEQAGRVVAWLIDGVLFEFDEGFEDGVHDKIGKEKRATDVARGNADPVQATEDAFFWSAY